MDGNYELCFVCKHFDRYYTKGDKQFNRTKFGWCCAQQTTCAAKDSCKNFSRTKYHKKSNRLISYYLSDLLKQLAEIRNVIEEEQREAAEQKDL